MLWGVIPALFAVWAFSLLQKYYRTNPAGLDGLAGNFLPSASRSEFAWGNVFELWGRVFSGHSAVAVFAAALLAMGAFGARLLGRPRPASGGWAIQCIGLGMSLGLLMWTGLGLAGLYFEEVAWILAITAIIAGLARASFSAGTMTAFAGRWLFLGLGATLAMAVFLAGTVLLVSRSGPRPGAAWTAWIWAGLVLGGWSFLAARALSGAKSGILLRLLGFELAAAMLMVAAACMTPERFYDAQVYHLACPALFSMHHKLIGLPNLMHSSFPLGMQMLYQWQWLLGGEPAARAWRPWLLGLILWAVWRMGQREGRPAAGLAAAAIFATCPLLLLNVCQTSVDLEVCFMVFLACLALREAYRSAGPGGWLAAGAAYCGAAAAMKYTAVFWVPWLILLSAAKGGRRGFAGKAGIATAVLFIWLCPWFGRNWAVVGNPVYPYATAIFSGGRQWEPARLERFLEQQASYVIKQAREIPKLPWRLCNGNNSENYIGPVFALFLPLLVLVYPRGPAISFYGAVAVLSLAAWLGITHIHRFALATWGLLALLTGWAVTDLAGRRKWFGRAVVFLLALAGLFNIAAVAGIWRHIFDPVDFLAGRESASAYLERKMVNSYYAVAAGPGSRLGSGARVIMAGETRGLYWPRPFVNHSVYDMQAFEEAVRDSHGGKEAAKRLRQRGATHVFFNDGETSRLKNRFGYEMLVFSEREESVIRELWSGYMDEVQGGPKYQRLYRVRAGGRTGAAPSPPLSLDKDELRKEFEGYTTISWQGEGAIQAVKKAKAELRR